MKGKFRKPMALLTVLICFSLLGGCGWQKTEEDDAVTLWVVTEQSCTDGMNLQAQMIAQRMEETYEGLTVQLDILPTDEQERDIYLTQLRTQIMAGGGPDVYLLPTGDILSTDYIDQDYLKRQISQVRVEPLFQDVTQAMRAGVFADIQEYFDEDQALGKEALKTEVMDAGVIDGQRFVLPLRFDIPTVMTDAALWDGYGLSQEVMDSNVTVLVGTLLAQENGAAASVGVQLPSDLSLLPQLFDYEKEEVLVTTQEIGDYMRLYQAWTAAATGATEALLKELEDTYYDLLMAWLWDKGVDQFSTMEELREFSLFDGDLGSFNNAWAYILMDTNWHTAGLPLYTSALADTVESAAVSQHAGFPMTMVPLRTEDGSVVASVTYFGAVGSGCKDPALAYEFLRQFLTEEFQWDIYRPRVIKDLTFLMGQEKDVQTPGQIEDSWPVRTVGSVPYLWSSIRYQFSGAYTYLRSDGTAVSRELQGLVLTDEDIPALSWELDEVRFPVVLDESESLEYALSLLNEADGTPTDVDIDALAEEVRLNLWWHLAEG